MIVHGSQPQTGTFLQYPDLILCAHVSTQCRDARLQVRAQLVNINNR